MSVNVPEPPAVPHVPELVDPFSEVTKPNIDTVGGTFGDQIFTCDAVNTPFTTDPIAPTDSSTHTFANVGFVRCRPVNVVDGLTEIVVVAVLRPTIVNVPDAPATPHAPSAVDPFTALTSPKAFTGGWSATAVPTPARQN